MLNKFLSEEKASVLGYWLLSLFGIVFIIISYAFTLPLGNIFIKVFVENGTPLAEVMWVRTCTIWGFGIIGVLMVAIGFMASYVRTYDTGIKGWNQ